MPTQVASEERLGLSEHCRALRTPPSVIRRRGRDKPGFHRRATNGVHFAIVCFLSVHRLPHLMLIILNTTSINDSNNSDDTAEAAAQAGVADPYLERARKRRFPKARFRLSIAIININDNINIHIYSAPGSHARGLDRQGRRRLAPCPRAAHNPAESTAANRPMRRAPSAPRHRSDEFENGLNGLKRLNGLSTSRWVRWEADRMDFGLSRSPGCGGSAGLRRETGRAPSIV